LEGNPADKAEEGETMMLLQAQSDPERLQGVMDTFVSTLKIALEDMFKTVGAIGGPMIGMMFLVTMMLLLVGIILTVMWVCLYALNGGRRR
jgi:hypothetical protein